MERRHTPIQRGSEPGDGHEVGGVQSDPSGNVVPFVLTRMEIHHYAMPDIETLIRLKAADPNAYALILRDFEGTSQHNRELDRQILEQQGQLVRETIANERLGMIGGMTAVFLFVAGGIFCVFRGVESGWIILLAGALGPLVAALRGRR